MHYPRKSRHCQKFVVNDLGIEFVHFDQDDKPESQHVVPLGNFMSDQPLTSEEYLITRSLVAAQAIK
jgi:hypothetical protein